MKRIVNGVETELETGSGSAKWSDERILLQTENGRETAVAVRSGDTVLVSFRGHQYVVSKPGMVRAGSAHAGSGEIRAPMPGAIVSVLVKAGDAVSKGDKIAVLEAMKTQQGMLAPFDGVIAEIRVQPGEQVSEADLIAVVREKTPE